MITIVNYGMGNSGSMLNMFKRIGVDACIQSDPLLIKQAKKIILPGVGAFDSAMARINDVPNMREVLEEKALGEKIPVLGICLGMQLLTRSSEEGVLKGLGWIPAETTRLNTAGNLKVPHMGWNLAVPIKTSKLTSNLEAGSRYYFVHSYCVHVDDRKHSLMSSNYGVTFDSAIGSENIYGVQFHPEKSHRFGMQILKNFAKL